MMPSVPSAPMNSLVTSQPADDLRERRRVLITSPFGSTTVWDDINVMSEIYYCKASSPRSRTTLLWQYHTWPHSLFAFSTIWIKVKEETHVLPEHPVPIIPPIVWASHAQLLYWQAHSYSQLLDQDLAAYTELNFKPATSGTQNEITHRRWLNIDYTKTLVSTKPGE